MKQLAVILMALAMVVQGCTVGSVLTNLEKYVPVGLEAFAGVVTLINPPAGSALAGSVAIAKAAWADLSAAITAYNSAPAADKATALGKVETALSAVISNLTAFISLIPPAQAHAAQITAALELIETTLLAIQAQLPAGTATKPAVVKTLPVAPRSVKQFKQQYNQIMAGLVPAI